MTISILPENVLLEIFVFYRSDNWHGYPFRVGWEWHLLVHVCRSWRQIIFASPRYLDLRILCTPRTTVRKVLGIWPDFPIAMDSRYRSESISPDSQDNVIAVLEQPDRLRFLGLDVESWQFRNIAPVMQNPFPVLMHP